MSRFKQTLFCQGLSTFVAFVVGTLSMMVTPQFANAQPVDGSGISAWGHDIVYTIDIPATGTFACLQRSVARQSLLTTMRGYSASFCNTQLAKYSAHIDSSRQITCCFLTRVAVRGSAPPPSSQRRFVLNVLRHCDHMQCLKKSSRELQLLHMEH